MAAPDRRSDRVLSHPALPLVVAVGAFALFTWPMLRTPPPSAATSTLFLFAAWALVIVVLYFMGRSAAEEAPEEPGERGEPDA